MPGRLKRSAVVVAAFAGFFYWGFMTAKHDPSLRDIVPFGEDPYDAVGSFAVIVAVLVAVLSLARAFRPYRSSGPSSAEVTYLLRSLATVALAALITVGSNAIAMVRHPSQLSPQPSCCASGMGERERRGKPGRVPASLASSPRRSWSSTRKIGYGERARICCPLWRARCCCSCRCGRC